MENFTHILQGAEGRQTRATKIRQHQEELEAGMLIMGYVPYSLLEDEDTRQERVLSFSNKDYIVTFYLTPEELIGLKIFSKKNGFIRSTSNFPAISITDARTIISKLL